jgi:hypothetical protein
MQNDTRKKAIDKIKKCLALSASSNPHEAEAALRQARKLMETHSITDLDMQAAEAGEHHAKASAQNRPSTWETMLAHKIADAFGCHVIFSIGFWSRPGEWRFIGCGSASEVAHYAFAVLHRQAKRARAEYVKASLKRCKSATKTRRADLFCEGWVRAVAGTITVFCGTERSRAAIDAYVAKNYPALSHMDARDRNIGHRMREHEYGDYTAGSITGQSAVLHRGVGGVGQRRALE